MSMKLCCSSIVSVCQIALNSWKIHWFFNYVKVIKNSISFWVNWSQKRKCTFMFLQKIQYVVTLSELIFNRNFSRLLLSHFLRLFLKKFINFFYSNSLWSSLYFFSILRISWEFWYVLSLIILFLHLQDQA